MKQRLSMILLFWPLMLASSMLAAHCRNGIPADNPDHAYIAHGDGTVTDSRNGLMWKSCVEGQTWAESSCLGSASEHQWVEALAVAANSDFAGYADWRLPNVKELDSLIEGCTAAPSINPSVFPNTPLLSVWTSSPTASDEFEAWCVNMEFGHVFHLGRHEALHVRLVRGGD